MKVSAASLVLSGVVLIAKDSRSAPASRSELPVLVAVMLRSPPAPAVVFNVMPVAARRLEATSAE